MKGHDGIIIVLCIFLCFSVPQMYKIQKAAATSNQRIKLNMYLDTAVESAAYGNYEIIDGTFVWDKEKVLDSFMTEVNNMLKLEYERFPVFLIRQGKRAFFYSNGKWEEVELGREDNETAGILTKKLEQLLGCSSVESIFLPTGNESDYCNPVYEYSILAIMKVKKASYVVSGAAVVGTVT